MRHSTELLVEQFRRGIYENMNLFEKQLMALEILEDDVTNELLYGGGARGGKSWIASTWKVFRRLAYSGSVGLMSREEMTKLRDTTMNTFFKVCDWFGLEEGLDYTVTGGKDVDFFNGSKEMFRDLKYLPVKDPEFDRIGSYDLTDAAIDESQQINWKAIEALKARFSLLTGENEYVSNGIKRTEPWQLIPKTIYSCNPAKNWIHTDFYTPWRTNTLEDGRAFIPALATDNPHVDPSYIEFLKKADKTTRERLLYGNFDYDDDPDSLCSWDEILDIFNNDHIKPDDTERYLVADLAMMGRDLFIVMYKRGMFYEISIVKAKSTAKEIEEDLRKEKVQKGVPNRKIIADSDGLGSYLSSYIDNITEFRGGKAAKDKQYDSIKDECGFKLAEMIKDSKIKVSCEKKHEEEIKRQLSICLKRSPNVDDKKHKLIKKSDMKEKLGCSPDYFDVLLMSMLPEIEAEESAIW